MIFSSLEYLLFLPLVVLLYWRLNPAARLLLVVVSSLFFYMSWLPAYGVLLLILSTLTWAFGLGVAKSPQGSLKAKLYLWAGLALSLGSLCYYKYTGFIIDNALAALNLARTVGGFPIPAWDAPVINVMLPLGISFFVFEFIHYLVDVYKGAQPIKSWMEFTAFAAFFPSQIAGPIKRYQDFVLALRDPAKLTIPRFYEAMTLIVQGLFKKVAIADPLGLVIYPLFASTSLLSCPDALVASIGFVIQVYCDFSGYTDIGRGSALLMGVRLPENFNLPYLAADITEFWRRWHMSLSSWLRDYVFIPLGGSKFGTLLTWRNLFATMIVCGLWHGASWNYIIFGFLQGLGLAVHREWNLLTGGHKAAPEKLTSVADVPKYVWGVFLTMAFMTLALIFFRSPDLPHAMNIFRSLANFSGECESVIPLVKSGAPVFLATYLCFWLADTWKRNKATQRKAAGLEPEQTFASDYLVPALRFASWTAAALLMLAATPTESVPFVYFQF